MTLAESLLTQRFTQGADTRMPIPNAGDWKGYIGTNTDPERGDIVFGTAEWNDKKTGEPKSAETIEVFLYTEDPAAIPEGGISPVRCRWNAFLDTDANGALDMGKNKNRKLGALLTAVGIQDKTGKLLKADWGVADLYGKPLLFRVSHSANKKTGDPQADVTMVAALA